MLYSTAYEQGMSRVRNSIRDEQTVRSFILDGIVPCFLSGKTRFPLGRIRLKNGHYNDITQTILDETLLRQRYHGSPAACCVWL